MCHACDLLQSTDMTADVALAGDSGQRPPLNATAEQYFLCRDVHVTSPWLAEDVSGLLSQQQCASPAVQGQWSHFLQHTYQALVNMTSHKTADTVMHRQVIRLSSGYKQSCAVYFC